VLRRQESTRRSTDYYRTPEGKAKKQEQNKRRGSPGPSPEAERGSRRSPEEPVLDSDIVRYLAMVVSLIEGRRVSEAEIPEMVKRAVRQHSIARRRRRDYVWSCWKGTLENP
jgi:hypothetical protein